MAISKGRREYLDRQPWEEIVPRAVLYAARRLERCEWQGSRKGSPPMGKTAQDFVNGLISEVYENEERKWDMEKHPDFLPILCELIKSEISNSLKKIENKLTLCEKAVAAKTPENPPIFPMDTIVHPSASTDQSLLQQEKEVEDSKWLMNFMTHIEGEADLMGVLQCKLDGVFKPAEIAEILGLSEQQMESLQKKWQRRLDGFQEKMGIKAKSKKRGGKNG